MRKSVMGVSLKREFSAELLAFTLAATLAFPAASLSFVAQAFATTLRMVMRQKHLPFL